VKRKRKRNRPRINLKIKIKIKRRELKNMSTQNNENPVLFEDVVIAVLNTYPEKIKDQQIQLLDKQIKLEQTRKELKMIEYEVSAKVGADTNIKNETLRKAMIISMLQTNPEYTALSFATLNLEKETELLKINIEYMIRKVSAYKSIVDLIRKE
jgi:hypothetical protein